MNPIVNIANKFYEEKVNISYDNYMENVEGVKNVVNGLYNKADKIKFLEIIIKNADDYLQDHLAVCKEGKDCYINTEFPSFLFYLKQELIVLGIDLNGDIFTSDDISSAEKKLEEIILTLEEIKVGQHAIFDEFVEQIEELKEYYFLGKRKWHQLLLGKASEMTVSGVVSETLSKKIVSLISTELPKLIS